jgi:hypothetical protein
LTREKLPEIDAAIGSRPHIDSGSGSNDSVRQYLSPPFETKKEESVFHLRDWTTECATKLMLVMTLSGETLRVKLECICIQNVITPEVEGGAMKVFGAILDDCIDRTATSAPILCVVGVRHDFEFMHGVNIWRDFPLTRVGTRLLGYRCAIESELVVKT